MDILSIVYYTQYTITWNKEFLNKLKKQRTGKRIRGRQSSYPEIYTHLQNKNTYYVESESSDSRYYFVRFNPSVFQWCSCKDFESNRSERCKHLYALEYGIRYNTIKEVDRLPEETKIKKDKDNAKATITESWKNDEYSF